MSPTPTGLRPELFRDDAVPPETAAYNARLREQVAALPHPTTIPIEESRKARDEGRGVLGAARPLEFARELHLGQVPSRVLRPDRIDGIYFYIHGGGWAAGRPWYSDEALWSFAQACNVATLSGGYRLAPEHPYPAGPDDCEAVALWLIHNAKAEFGTERIVIGGSSAGGHLAAVTLQRLRDRHGYTGFAGADLVYGCFDMAGTPWMRTFGQTVPIWDWRSHQLGIERFAPGRDLRDPDISPLYGSLHDMPPALFSVGTHDSLLDDSLFMYSRWIAAWNRAELALYPGAVHGFDNLPIPAAAEARERRAAFIRDCIAGS